MTLADLAILDLTAAGLSLVAWFDHRQDFYIFTRAVMMVLGATIAWNAAMADTTPVWITLALVGSAVAFIPGVFPARLAWLVLNPVISAGYVAHAAFLALKAAGGV